MPLIKLIVHVVYIVGCIIATPGFLLMVIAIWLWDKIE